MRCVILEVFAQVDDHVLVNTLYVGASTDAYLSRLENDCGMARGRSLERP